MITPGMTQLVEAYVVVALEGLERVPACDEDTRRALRQLKDGLQRVADAISIKLINLDDDD